MEPGTRLDLNSFVGKADNLERRLYRTWPLFHIYVFGQISLIFKKFYPFIYQNEIYLMHPNVIYIFNT